MEYESHENVRNIGKILFYFHLNITVVSKNINKIQNKIMNLNINSFFFCCRC